MGNNKPRLFDKAKWQRENRAKNGNLSTKRYEKTKNGFLMRTYRNMFSRVSGIQRKKAHLYFGKPIMEKSDFYIWALSSKDFHELFGLWEVASYDRRLTPSIDRINPDDGYVPENIRWVTHSQNSRQTRRQKKLAFICHR